MNGKYKPCRHCSCFQALQLQGLTSCEQSRMQPDIKAKTSNWTRKSLCGTYFSILTFIRTYELIKWEYRLVQFSLAPIFFDQRFRFLLFSLRTRKMNTFYWNILHLGLSEWKFVWFDIPKKSLGHPYSAIILKRRVLKKIHLKEPTLYWEGDR